MANMAPVFCAFNSFAIISKLVEPVNPYSNEHPYNNNPDDKALKIKYLIPDSEDLKLSRSIAANIYNDKDCNSNPR